MESYIQISKINDFLFCPKSLYFHSIYEKYDSRLYHSIAQQRGKIKHKSIDVHSYSSLKDILQGKTVYSIKYKILGKIDLFFVKEGKLVERKYQIRNIYKGYKYQLYAQMFCLEEMGYKVNRLELYSMKDNKKYIISKPNKSEILEFEILLEQIWKYNINDYINWKPENKLQCEMCIYKNLCV